MEFEEFVEKLGMSLKRKKSRRVVKRMAIRPEWQAILNQDFALGEQEESIHRQRAHLDKKLWAMIGDDLECYQDMELDKIKGELMIYETEAETAKRVQAGEEDDG